MEKATNLQKNFRERSIKKQIKEGNRTTEYDEVVEKNNQERGRIRAESDPILKDA